MDKISYKIRYYKSFNHIVGVISNNSSIPMGFYITMRSTKDNWGITIGTTKIAPRGIGKILLGDLLKQVKKINIKKVNLMTSYDNFLMLACAIKNNFKIIKRDNYGYLLEKNV